LPQRLEGYKKFLTTLVPLTGEAIVSRRSLVARRRSVLSGMGCLFFAAEGLFAYICRSFSFLLSLRFPPSGTCLQAQPGRRTKNSEVGENPEGKEEMEFSLLFWGQNGMI
jgi:hypothetical protein